MVDIVFKNRDFVIINKYPGCPSQSDMTGDADAMRLTSDMLYLADEYEKLWLIHRLDRVVGGLLVFARSKSVAAELSRLVAEDGLGKHYLAVVEGEAEGGTLCDYIYRDSVSMKAHVSKTKRAGYKAAELEYINIKTIELDGKWRSLVDIRLKTGRFHQIRAQFSSRNMPLVGDKKYGSRDAGAKFPALFAYRLEFSLYGKSYDFSVMPNQALYPWCLFDEKCFSL